MDKKTRNLLGLAILVLIVAVGAIGLQMGLWGGKSIETTSGTGTTGTGLPGTGSGLPGSGGGLPPVIQMKCSLPTALITTPLGGNANPEVSKDYVVYEYTPVAQSPCGCIFVGNFAPGNCDKGCSLYGKAGERCMVQSDCMGTAHSQNTRELFAYDLKNKFEFPIAQAAGSEVSPAVYGNKVVYFVSSQSDYVKNKEYDPVKKTYTTTRPQGKVVLYDISTRTSTVVATTNYWKEGSVVPRIYDDSIVWADGEKADIKSSSVGNNSDTYYYSYEVVGKPTIYSYNIPLQRKTKLFENPVGLVVSFQSAFWLGGVDTAWLWTSGRDGYPEPWEHLELQKGQSATIGDQTIIVTAVRANVPYSLTVKVCKGNLCTREVVLSQGDIKFVSLNYINPDVYEERISYQSDVGGTDDAVYYNLVSDKGFGTAVSGNAGEDRWPKIHQNSIIWTEDKIVNQQIVRNIVFYDIAKGTTTNINSAASIEDNHDIYGTHIVWADGAALAGTQNIRYYKTNDANLQLLKVSDLLDGAQNFVNDIRPANYGKTIVWERAGDIYTATCSDEAVPNLPNCVYWTVDMVSGKRIASSLTFSNQQVSSVDYKAAFLADCRGRLLQLKKNDCSGEVVTECYVGSFPQSDCKGTFVPPSVAGNYKYVLCDPRDGQASTVSQLIVR